MMSYYPNNYWTICISACLKNVDGIWEDEEKGNVCKNTARVGRYIEEVRQEIFPFVFGL
jgi:hypothetical protein